MKTQFPKTLILGLTATATSSVIADIQKILSIEGCLIFKDSFFRSNLKYIIERTDPKKEDIIERVVKLLKTKYLNESEIIYLFDD
jgi:ATP-dependent DNA helicase Q1